jgi:hypothetical protein
MPLGKLVKWLRLLGFDTIYEPEASFQNGSGEERILLLRKVTLPIHIKDRKIIKIRSNTPIEQVREVIRALGVRLEDVRPFSRCSLCNLPLRKADPREVQYRVPEYVWETQERFHICDRCERIYWPGTHKEHAEEVINRLFKGDYIINDA